MSYTQAYQPQLPEINFSNNWNKKLDNTAFTTIRLENPNKYKIGQQYEIKLNHKKITVGKIIEIRKLMFKDINEFIAYLDTGYSSTECKKIIQKMYPSIDFTHKFLYLILIKKLNRL